MNYQTERYIRDIFKEAQRGICPICQKPLTGRISLDHSLSTGEPRGLLHQSCNMKVAQIETHTKRLNYIISRQLEARIRDYIAQHCRIFVSTLNEEIK